MVMPCYPPTVNSSLARESCTHYTTILSIEMSNKLKERDMIQCSGHSRAVAVPVSIPDLSDVRKLAAHLHAPGQPYHDRVWGWEVTYEPELTEPYYLANGSRLVWLIYPNYRLVEVYRLAADVEILGEEDSLTGGDVLPGFALPAREVFADPAAE
jgi:hypothetical protein